MNHIHVIERIITRSFDNYHHQTRSVVPIKRLPCMLFIHLVVVPPAWPPVWHGIREHMNQIYNVYFEIFSSNFVLCNNVLKRKKILRKNFSRRPAVISTLVTKGFSVRSSNFELSREIWTIVDWLAKKASKVLKKRLNWTSDLLNGIVILCMLRDFSGALERSRSLKQRKLLAHLDHNLCHIAWMIMKFQFDRKHLARTLNDHQRWIFFQPCDGHSLLKSL